jgi:hypothetical protein
MVSRLGFERILLCCRLLYTISQTVGNARHNVDITNRQLPQTWENHKSLRWVHISLHVTFQPGQCLKINTSELNVRNLGFEVLTAVVMKSSSF